MTVMYKYVIPIADEVLVPMPKFAMLRHVAMQGSALTIWAEVDPNSGAIDRYFKVIGTGHPVPDDGAYLGTTLDGRFVWHLFEIVSNRDG